MTDIKLNNLTNTQGLTLFWWALFKRHKALNFAQNLKDGMSQPAAYMNAKKLNKIK